VDISLALLDEAERNLPPIKLGGLGLIHGDIRQLYCVNRTWDLIIARAVLMHIPPADIKSVIDKLWAYTDHHLVTLDWDDDTDSRKEAGYQFQHSYDKLLPGATKYRLGSAVLRRWEKK
jgi:hypothetical protein